MKHGYSTPSAGRDRDARRGSGWRTLLLLGLFAWALRSLVVAPFSIPSGSMLPTMAIGDYLFVAKWPYGYSRFSFPLQFPPLDGRLLGRLPARGDIVVFKPASGEDRAVVKRVIGLPGDRVAVDGGTLFLNGQAVPRVAEGEFAMTISANSPCRVVPGATPRDRPDPAGGHQCLYPAYRETLPNGVNYVVLDQVDQAYADHFGPVTVPAGHVFLMGDNRDDSLDSRFPPSVGGMGFVPVERLIGRASLVFWSTDGSARLANPVSWLRALRTDRVLKVYR